MASSKRAAINTLIEYVVSGTPKVAAIRHCKNAFNLNEDEIEWLVEACNFKSPPKKINFEAFYNCAITKKAKKVDNPNLQLYYIDNFLSKIDCQLLRGYMEQNAEPAVLHDVGSQDDVRVYKKNERTSSTVFLNWTYHSFFKDVDQKIVKLMELHRLIGEGMMGQKYEIGEFYTTQSDYFLDEDLKIYTEMGGQRSWTTMLYLNDVEEGGETHFPNVDIKMKPKEGTLIAWNNRNLDGTNNVNTLHEALPPTSGKKYIITKWWRSWSPF